MSVKTRYLQLSDSIMMEYLMNDDMFEVPGEKQDGYLYTKLLNGRYAVLSPLECELKKDGDKYVTRKPSDIISVNTIHHFSVPTESKESRIYTFIDHNNEFTDDTIIRRISEDSVVMREYSKYCTNPYGESDEQIVLVDGKGIRLDKIRLYLVNGYDMKNVYGIFARFSVKRKDNRYLDLCDMTIDYYSAYTMMNYMSNPIIFGNFVYDRYIEISVMSIYDLITKKQFRDLNVDEKSPVIINFAYIDADDVKTEPVNYSIGETLFGDKNFTSVNCNYTKSIQLKGVIPVDRINSDNLGVYMCEDPEYPYIQFYGTWKEYPLTPLIVQNFNKTIPLYDKSLIRRKPIPYDVDNDYTVELDLKKWIAIHTLSCTLLSGDEVVRNEVYTITQTFDKTDMMDIESLKFRYRPTFFDEDELNLENTVLSIKYVMRFINSDDMVQFTKGCSISTTNVGKFYAKGTTLKQGSMTPYKVYNKIMETKNTISNESAMIGRTKYIKVFYNSTDIVLNNGEYDYSTGEYTLTLSDVPKTYKFVFKNKSYNGSMEYMDLTNGFYKLYIPNSGSPIIIEPTYSSNMNLMYGEIEFNINSSTLMKLKSIPESERKMSIVVYNEDNSVSSMYDFKFSL